jgi:hypothetical protein
VTARALLLAAALLAPAWAGAAEPYEALAKTMKSDLSERVRLAAAIAALAYPGGRALADADEFLKAEPGPGVRGEFLAALSTAPAHLMDPEPTRMLAAAAADDPSAEVRSAAARALGVRKALQLSSRPKPKPRPKVARPKEDAVMGQDPCPAPWGWCACAGVVTLKPRCLTRDECRGVQSEMTAHGLVCKWDGRVDE